jgi:hypothetical protein
MMGSYLDNNSALDNTHSGRASDELERFQPAVLDSCDHGKSADVLTLEQKWHNPRQGERSQDFVAPFRCLTRAPIDP